MKVENIRKAIKKVAALQGLDENTEKMLDQMISVDNEAYLIEKLQLAVKNSKEYACQQIDALAYKTLIEEEVDDAKTDMQE